MDGWIKSNITTSWDQKKEKSETRSKPHMLILVQKWDLRCKSMITDNVMDKNNETGSKSCLYVQNNIWPRKVQFPFTFRKKHFNIPLVCFPSLSGFCIFVFFEQNVFEYY